MSTLIGKQAPEFTANAVIKGEINTVSLKDFVGKYVVLFFYPKDFTYVCPTELHAFQESLKAFEDRNAVVLACSVDDEQSHIDWLAQPKNVGGLEGVTYPIISDTTKQISEKYQVLKHDEGLSYRGLFLIDKTGIVRHAVINDLPLGRNVKEEIRMLDALIFFEQNGLVCPANWEKGSQAMAPNEEGLLSFFGSID